MSGFSSQWLRLREPADRRARHDFSAQLNAREPPRWNVVDLGCGTGSNLRFLAPRLLAPQTWTCFDNDRALLEALSAATAQTDRCSVTSRHAELADDVARAIDAAHAADTLVTASALLDLVSADFIDTLAGACARANAAALFALTYDGRIELEPADGADAPLRSLVNDHQRRDKGFGPALGPAAAAYCRTAFERAGYDVIERRSDWRLGAGDEALQTALLEGWAGAAREQGGDSKRLSDWMALRRSQIAAGELRVAVGHRDLFAVRAARRS